MDVHVRMHVYPWIEAASRDPLRKASTAHFPPNVEPNMSSLFQKRHETQITKHNGLK